MLPNSISYSLAKTMQLFHSSEPSVIDVARALASAAGQLAEFDADLVANNVGPGILAVHVNAAQDILTRAAEFARERRSEAGRKFG